MTKLIASAVTALFLAVSVNALANEDTGSATSYDTTSSAQGTTSGAPGTVGEATPGTTGVSQAEAQKITRGVYDSPLTITPNFGVLGFQDGQLNYTSRALEGINLSWNISNASTTLKDAGIYSGIELGWLYSHVGAPSSNFFGTNPSVALNQGANSFLVPAELTFGYHPVDKLLTALRFGANMLYRSDASSMHMGRSNDLKGVGNSAVDFFPSLGLTTGWSFGKTAALELRGDYIPVPANDMYNLMLGVTFPLA